MVEINKFRKKNKIVAILKFDLKKILAEILKDIEKEELNDFDEIELLGVTDGIDYDNAETFRVITNLSIKNLNINNNINEIYNINKLDNIIIDNKNGKLSGKDIKKSHTTCSTIPTIKIHKPLVKKHVDLDGFSTSKKVQKCIEKAKIKNEKKDDVMKWTANQFMNYMQEKFTSTYGHNSLEFNSISGKTYNNAAKGIIWVTIKKRLIELFKSNGMTNVDVVEYIDWMYDKKSIELKFPVTLNFLCNAGVITEWMMIKKNGGNSFKKGKSGKKLNVVNIISK